jgi:hypothetical protein
MGEILKGLGTMQINVRGLAALSVLVCTAVGAAHGGLDLTLNGSRWRVHARVTPDSKNAVAVAFEEELIFKDGILTTPSLQREGFGPARYHSGGIETFLKWGCKQISTTGETIVWEGIANRQHQRAWKMEGSIVRAFPDGRVYKYTLKGSGESVPIRAR